MLTGYTAAIEEGNTSAREFLTRCARAFGAFVHQREERPDEAPRPAEIKEDSYYQRSLSDAYVKLGRLKSLSQDQIRSMYDEYFDSITQSNLESIARHADLVAKYQKVRGAVEAWEPNEEAGALKEYALGQLKVSWPYDPHIVTPVETPEEWYDQELGQALRNIKYYETQLNEERERLRARREYGIKMLESIAEVPE